MDLDEVMKVKIVDREVDCPLHGRTRGVEVAFSDGTVKTSCSECEAERERLESESLEKARKDIEKRKRNERFRRLNIQKEYWDKSLSDYKPQTEMQARYLSAIKAMIRSGRGKIIVLGPNGTGKTMLSCEALKALGGVRYTMFELSVEVRSPERTDKEVIQELLDAPLLVIDEIGRSKGSEFETNLLSYVLDRRHSDDLPVIILSNTHLKDKCESGGCEKCFQNYFDSDLLSRFYQDGVVISFDKKTPDWRRMTRKVDWGSDER